MVIALLAIVALSPVMAVIALVIKPDDGDLNRPEFFGDYG